MHHPRAEFRLAQEALDGDGVLAEAGTQDLHRGEAALGVFGLVHRGGAALADVLSRRYPATVRPTRLSWLMGGSKLLRRPNAEQAQCLTLSSTRD